MKLFPRLANRFAVDVFADQVEIPFDRVACSPSHPLMVWPATGAERIRESELLMLRSRLREVADAHGYPQPLGSGEQTAVDIALARVLWESAGLTPAEASFGDVWSFLALVLVPDVVWWRAAGSTNIERFVATDLTRHTLARLWWRAHLFTWGLENAEEGWGLWLSSDIGEAELDQIQTRRGGYGRSPKAFRSLVRVYPAVADLAAERGINRRTFWRQSYLRWVLRLGAFTNFSGTAEHELDADFLALAADIATVTTSASDARAKMRDEQLDDPSSDVQSPKTFDGLPLSSIVVRLTEAVRSAGEVAKEDLCATFSRVSEVEVPSHRLEILSGIAWQGEALKYLKHDDAGGTTMWLPGSVLPAPDRRWGQWSIDSFKEHVDGLNGQGDLVTLCAELFAGRAGQTVKRVVRAAMRETG